MFFNSFKNDYYNSKEFNIMQQIKDLHHFFLYLSYHFLYMLIIYVFHVHFPCLFNLLDNFDLI